MAELGPTGGGWLFEPGSLDFPLVIAHRGDHTEAPENTLDAFDRALALGADGVELDVRLTVDGEVAVIHDRRIDVGGGRKVAVGRLSLAEINDARLASGIAAEVPTLATVLDRIPPSSLIDVELKVRGVGASSLVSRVVDAVRRADRFETVLVTSYNPIALSLLRRAEPRIVRGNIWGRGHPWPLRARWLSTVPDAHWLTPSENSFDAELLLRCHRLGRRVLAWDVDVGDMEGLAQAGLDAIVTDYPARIVQLRSEFSAAHTDAARDSPSTSGSNTGLV
jgi:glycerophosphoryl diester phosphodiesterase